MQTSPKSTHFSPSSPRNDESSSEKNLSPLTSPRACPQTASRGRPLEEIIGETFPPFDHQSAVVGPFQDETSRDSTFEQELSEMLLDVILECHAWSSARPKHETQASARKIEEKITAVMNVEQEQEKTRERLSEFVARMGAAIAALTGIGI